MHLYSTPQQQECLKRRTAAVNYSRNAAARIRSRNTMQQQQAVEAAAATEISWQQSMNAAECRKTTDSRK